MLIPRPFTIVDGRGSFETQHSEDAVNEWAYSACLFRSYVCVTPSTGKAFMESLILAQDERWRRA
jgi:hypothetical protein